MTTFYPGLDGGNNHDGCNYHGNAADGDNLDDSNEGLACMKGILMPLIFAKALTDWASLGPLCNRSNCHHCQGDDDEEGGNHGLEL